MNFIFGKFGLLLIAVLFSFVAGMFLMQKVFTPAPEKFNYDQVRAIVKEEIKNIPCDSILTKPQ